jgi:hypothetical protein
MTTPRPWSKCRLNLLSRARVAARMAWMARMARTASEQESITKSHQVHPSLDISPRRRLSRVVSKARRAPQQRPETRHQGPLIRGPRMALVRCLQHHGWPGKGRWGICPTVPPEALSHAKGLSADSRTPFPLAISTTGMHLQTPIGMQSFEASLSVSKRVSTSRCIGGAVRRLSG